MGLYEAFSANEISQRDGVWCDYGDFKVLVSWAGSANPAYEKAMERHTRPFRKHLDSPHMVMPDSMKESMALAFKRVYAKTILIDWEGVTKDGEPLDYSYENCLQVFEELPSFFREIQEFSTNLENYQTETTESDAKNS